MAQVSNETLAVIRNEMQGLRNKLANANSKVRGGMAGKTETVKAIGEATIAAGVIGYLRGKYQQPDGSWEFMGFDIELAAGLLLVGLPLSGLKTGLPDKDLSNAGVGILSHFTGQVARKYAQTGQFSLVAGTEVSNFIGAQRSYSLPHYHHDNDDDDTYVGSLADATSF